MTASETEQKIANLHQWYCRRTGIVTKLCFARQLWFDRLREYEYDADKLGGDCDLVVIYLKKEIARDKRNLGALRLSNFLQPDTFDENLGLARLALNRRKRSQQAKESDRPKDAQPVGQTLDGTAIARRLREWRRGKGEVT
jgi:hypothetical protein